MQDGKIHPTVATTAPGIPAILSPTKVAELTAIGPGRRCRPAAPVCPPAGPDPPDRRCSGTAPPFPWRRNREA